MLLIKVLKAMFSVAFTQKYYESENRTLHTSSNTISDKILTKRMTRRKYDQIQKI